MTHAHTLTRHRDIQAWVTDRKGMPAIVRGPNRFGEMRSRLAIKFRGMGRPDSIASNWRCAFPKTAKPNMN